MHYLQRERSVALRSLQQLEAHWWQDTWHIFSCTPFVGFIHVDPYTSTILLYFIYFYYCKEFHWIHLTWLIYLFSYWWKSRLLFYFVSFLVLGSAFATTTKKCCTDSFGTNLSVHLHVTSLCLTVELVRFEENTCPTLLNIAHLLHKHHRKGWHF